MRSRIYYYIAILLFVANVHMLLAQRIRTDHREMTPGQKLAYVNAVNAIVTEIIDMAAFHATNFNTPIHSTTSGTGNGKQFLPWHRVHQLEMEEMLREAGTPNAPFLTIPYWDWRTEGTISGITWDDSGFLILSALSGSLSLTRSFSSTTLASTTDVNNLLALTSALYSPTTPTPDNTDNTTSAFFQNVLKVGIIWGMCLSEGQWWEQTHQETQYFFFIMDLLTRFGRNGKIETMQFNRILIIHLFWGVIAL